MHERICEAHMLRYAPSNLALLAYLLFPIVRTCRNINGLELDGMLVKRLGGRGGEAIGVHINTIGLRVVEKVSDDVIAYPSGALRGGLGGREGGGEGELGEHLG